MVDFYRKQDIMESTIMKADKTLRMSDGILDTFLHDTNRWYSARASEKLVDDEDIMVFVYPSTDERDDKMIEVCEHYFMKEMFFSLSKEKDDIFWVKYLKSEIKWNNALPTIIADRIRGYKPAIVSSTNGFASIKKHRV